MRKILLLVVGTLLGTSLMSFAQAGDFEKSMKAALFVHDTASSFTAEQEVAGLYEAIADEYPDQWLANYWAAYIYTQLTNLYRRLPEPPADISLEELMTRAQQHLDQVNERLSEVKSDSVWSDVHALQAFVNFFNFRLLTAQNADSSTIDMARGQYLSEMQKSLTLNPENPLIMVLIGTSMLVNQNADFREFLAAKVLLNRANDLFKSQDTHRALSTRWNQEWLWLFWLKNAEAKLEQSL